jgi:leucine dehydrogenase
MWPYPSESDALTDALRLSRGMTYKAALAGLPQGGGKSVIIGDPRQNKTPALLRAMGRFVDGFKGSYVAAEDSGTSVEDLRIMGQETFHVAGIAGAQGLAEGRTGDPSPATAMGVFIGIRRAAKAVYGSDSLEGLRVGIQGLGNVGYRLAALLHEAGAKLLVSDVYALAAERCVSDFGAVNVSHREIYALNVDILAPCALGATLNGNTIPQIQAKIIAGAANNQLAVPGDDYALMKKGILYAPDYVINAGGIIEVYHETHGYDATRVKSHLERIGQTLDGIFRRSRQESLPTGLIADSMAKDALH